jgi:hypothetical protein
MKTPAMAGAIALALVACGGGESASADDQVCADLDEMFDVMGEGNADRFDAWFDDRFINGPEADDRALREAVGSMIDEYQKNQPVEQADQFGTAWAAATERCDQL